MIDRIRERTTAQRIRNGEGAAAIREAGTILDPDLLTVGFARRFTTYKRATLIFNDLERLEKIVTDPDRPVQLVFAGKAHPADVPGQELMRRIHDISRMPAFRGRVVLVEGYDISIARYLVSGVDVWLNTPRRPFEASGTSGMKVAMNGGANFSVLDGWWCEAAKDGVNGWNIGDARDVGDEERLTGQDALTLYEVLEGTIATRYYERNAQGIPDQWIQVAKNSMKSIPPVFNTDRMVSEYGRRFYFPAITKGRRLAAEGHALARDVAGWKAFMRRHWPTVSIRWAADGGAPRMVTFGDEVAVTAEVSLGPIPASDVLVEAYVMETGPAAREGALRIPLQPAGDAVDGYVPYRSTFVPPDSGRYTVTVRATPYHPELIHPYEIGLIRWLGVDSKAVQESGQRLGRVTAAASAAVPAGKEARDGGSAGA
jgi:glycogen phosphorylase